MGDLRDSVPPNVVIIDICIYCSQCKHVHRVVEQDETSGAYEMCPQCGTTTETVIGIHVSAVDENVLQIAYNHMKKPSMQKYLNKLLQWRQ